MQKLAPSDPAENGSFGWNSAIAGGAFFDGAYNANSKARQGVVCINR